jgi:hypothetical protein
MMRGFFIGLCALVIAAATCHDASAGEIKGMDQETCKIMVEVYKHLAFETLLAKDALGVAKELHAESGSEEAWLLVTSLTTHAVAVKYTGMLARGKLTGTCGWSEVSD